VIGQTVYRLKTIAVYLPGANQHIRAYALDYGDPSPLTRRSLLSSVQQYGKNVQLNPATGAITGGMALPAQTFTYQEDTAGKSLVSIADDAWCGSEPLLGDFNGDGKTDEFCSYITGNPVRLSTGTGFADPTPWLTTCGFQRPMAADVNARGASPAR
jgi:hypothetical protein